MKVINLILEGKFGLGVLKEEVNDVVWEMEDGVLVEEELYVSDWEYVKEKGGIVVGYGDDGKEYVIGSDDVSFDEMWEEMKEYFVKEYNMELDLYDWYERMVEIKGKLIDFNIGWLVRDGKEIWDFERKDEKGYVKNKC